MEDSKIEINCSHGKGVAAIVCCHILNSVDPVGFIENSSEPDDLQGWCYACEFVFEQEANLTEKFRKFNNAMVVCEKCYQQYKNAHSIA